MTIRIETSGSSIHVQAPYNSDFVARAKKLGGKWEKPNWVFDARDEERVRELCRELYGSDGLTTDLCTLRIEWRTDASASASAIEVSGRTIARAFGRDSGAKAGDGIVILSGGFGSGGSVKNWTTRVQAGTIVLVRDFPRAEAERHIAEQKADDNRVYSIEPEAPVIDREALMAERDKLRARIIEIENILAK